MKYFLILSCVVIILTPAQGKDKTRFDLVDLYKNKKVTVYNRAGQS